MPNSKFSEEELIRQLGWAVKIEWDTIPPFAQYRIMDRASETGWNFREALELFLRRPTDSPGKPKDETIVPQRGWY